MDYYEQAKKWLQKFLNKSDAVQTELNERWKLHANRRTLIILGIGGPLPALSYTPFF